jgi:membrane protease subunit HflC
VAKETFKEIIREKREIIMETVTAEARELAAPFGVRVLDVRVKRADLPAEVQASVFARMQAERQRIALRYRAEGEEKGRAIRADADKEREIILAKAYQESQGLRGSGDAEAIAVTGRAFGRDPGFYGFVRRLETYERVFSPDTTIVLRPDSDLLRYLDSPRERR